MPSTAPPPAEVSPPPSTTTTTIAPTAPPTPPPTPSVPSVVPTGGQARDRRSEVRGRDRGRDRGRGRSQDRARGRNRARDQDRVVVPSGQCECSECHLRSDLRAAVDGLHDRHFPWCSKYLLGTSWPGATFYVETVQEGLQSEVVYTLSLTFPFTHTHTHTHTQTIPTLKKRLKLYGAKISGKKQELVDRLTPLLNVAAPFLGPGSWYHFDKKETEAAMLKFCKENNVMVPSRY